MAGHHKRHSVRQVLAGSEVTFTLFQPPAMTDSEFETDAQTVERDLSTLKTVLVRTPSM